MNIKCLRCKGRNFCGRDFCPIIAKKNSMASVNTSFKQKENFSTQSPASFVGHKNYPNLNVGILAPPAKPGFDTNLYDSPRDWSSKNYGIPDLIGLRSSLLNSRFKANVHLTNPDKALKSSQEISLSRKAVDVDVNLKQKPSFRISYDSMTPPMGPRGDLKKFELTSNPRISRKVDQAVSDTGLKAGDALKFLYKHNHDENFLSKALSMGNFGLKQNRKLVPTRWSITATDDSLGTEYINQIRQYPETDYQAFFGGYLGNHFLVLFLPEKWSYELFETYMPNVSWNTTRNIQYTTDYEDFRGRTTYAENCAGGYYAARLPVTEKLRSMKRQATCIVFRTITSDYAVPLGVWVVREATRKALNTRPLKFDSRARLFNYAKILAYKKFGYDLNQMLKKSKLLNQRKLTQF